MDKYQIHLTQSVVKKLSKLPANIEDRLVSSIQSLSHDPRPQGCKKLKGKDGYRIRVGDYRIIYQIKDNVLTILVVDIGHRRDIYQ